MEIDARGLDFAALNRAIRQGGEKITVKNCLGQRFIASGMGGIELTLEGIPGNALGAYLGGAHITVCGNAQDAVGDTMNAGEIVIHGNVGDTVGYAMRDGAIYVRGNAGYRAGIHMKEYKEKKPVLVIGGRAGSFLGEYQAGGVIVVLGLGNDGKPMIGDYPCTGMHGGRMYLRGEVDASVFPRGVTARVATEEDKQVLFPLLERFCALFGYDAAALRADTYTLVTPDSKNPYKQMYVGN